MNDKEFNALRSRIDKIAKWWIKQSGLGWWKISLVYDRDTTPQGDGTGDYHLAATCSAKWQYLDATLTFNMQAFTETSSKNLEKTIVHELMHIFVNEMREKGTLHEERVVTSLAKGFIWIRDEGIAIGKREAKKEALGA